MDHNNMIKSDDNMKPPSNLLSGGRVPASALNSNSTSAAAAPQEQPMFTNTTASNSYSHGNDVIPKQTIINGNGLWKSWTRNFNRPILALLDLLDNAFDATLDSTSNVKGRVQTQPDREIGNNNITGIVILNSSIKPIKPLDKVLEVYTSNKGSGTESIGENGVGLKQGCATLSDLSFVLSSNVIDSGMAYEKCRQFSLGIIAYKLQTDTKCSLPSFTFTSNDMKSLGKEMIHLFMDEDNSNHYTKLVAECIADYGNGSILYGIERLLECYNRMTSTEKGWESYDHVFGLIIHNLRHGENSKQKQNNNNNVDNSNNNTSSSGNDKLGVLKLLTELKDDLPKRYLHIPNKVHVSVGKVHINFNYWQPRLVELTKFDLHINKNIPLTDDPYWKSTPDTAPDSWLENVYTIKLYIGFDPIRLNEESSNPYLYYHSRESGRLIKRNADARAELKLPTGSTDFCQGLTIILDDIHGGLPLNPTKQDVAFSEHANGEIHHNNLQIWVGIAVRAYWKYFHHILGQSKGAIGDAVKYLLNDAKQLVDKQSTSKTYTPLNECTFNTFGDYISGITKGQQNPIRLKSLSTVIIHRGIDTKLRIDPTNQIDDYDVVSSSPKKRKSPATSSTTKKRKKATPIRRSSSTNTEQQHRSPYFKSPRQPKQVQYYEGDEDDDDDDEVFDDDELVEQGKPQQKSQRRQPNSSRRQNNVSSSLNGISTSATTTSTTTTTVRNNSNNKRPSSSSDKVNTSTNNSNNENDIIKKLKLEINNLKDDKIIITNKYEDIIHEKDMIIISLKEKINDISGIMNNKYKKQINILKNKVQKLLQLQQQTPKKEQQEQNNDIVIEKEMNTSTTTTKNTTTTTTTTQNHDDDDDDNNNIEQQKTTTTITTEEKNHDDKQQQQEEVQQQQQQQEEVQQQQQQEEEVQQQQQQEEEVQQQQEEEVQQQQEEKDDQNQELSSVSNYESSPEKMIC